MNKPETSGLAFRSHLLLFAGKPGTRYLRHRGGVVPDFSVNPAALTAYAKILSNASVGASGIDAKYLIDAGNYADEHVKLEDSAGGALLKAVAEKSNEVHQQLLADNSVISATLMASADGLNKAADAYKKSDSSAAEGIDSVYKPAGIIPREFTVDDSAPQIDPSTKLAEPSEDGPVPEPLQQVLDGAGYASESDLVIKVASLAGFDIKDKLTEWLFGDFKSIARVKGAIENLSKFDAAAATDLAEGADVMFRSWTGNGADAAKSFFDQVVNALESHASALTNLADKYKNILVGIQQLTSAIEGVITGLIDAAAEALVATLTAGSLQEVPVVDVAADITAAAKIVEVVKKIHDVLAVWNFAWSGGEGVIGLSALLTSSLADCKVSAKLPKMGYYNAAQGPAPKVDDGSSSPGGMHGPR